MSVQRTPAMGARLLALADEDPSAKVVGVHGNLPLIRRGDGRVQYLNQHGRLVALRGDS